MTLLRILPYIRTLIPCITRYMLYVTRLVWKSCPHAFISFHGFVRGCLWCRVVRGFMLTLFIHQFLVLHH